MRNRFSFLLLLLAALVLAVVPGCDGAGPDASTELVKGPMASVEGGGVAYAWTRLGSDGQPMAVGVSLSEAAYASLTNRDDDHNASDKHGGPSELTLPMPDAAPAPYNHATIDWWPEGHPPPNVYTVPHLDAHFYFVSQEKRESVQPGPAQVYPDERFVPDGYVADSVNVPGDGMHYLNLQAPEFNGEPFTHTFIYGFYRGTSTFIEPMASTDLLSSQPDVAAQVPQPEAYQRAGLYPARYRVAYNDDAEEHRFVLERLQRHEGSAPGS